MLACSPQNPAGGSEEDPVGVAKTRPADLAAKDRKLVSEHDDLELLELTRTETQQPPLTHAETIDTPATRARADSFHQEANEPRLYGREVSSEVPSATRRIYAPHTPPWCATRTPVTPETSQLQEN
jgi:hypothetical protein